MHGVDKEDTKNKCMAKWSDSLIVVVINPQQLIPEWTPTGQFSWIGEMLLSYI
jgi:hypothetical protein